MALDHGIRLPYSLAFEFYDFVDQSLHNSDTQVIVLSFVLVVNNYKVLMYCEEKSFHLDLFD